MIFDKIDNLEQYAGISEDLRLGLEYLKNVSPDVEVGVHELSPRVKAIVSDYTTKVENEKNGYEAHREWIDIQYLLRGSEKICCPPLEYLKETKAYGAAKDAAFYVEAVVAGQEMLVGNGYFAIFFPQDGHKPGLCAGECEAVKKVVANRIIRP